MSYLVADGRLGVKTADMIGEGVFQRYNGSRIPALPVGGHGGTSDHSERCDWVPHRKHALILKIRLTLRFTVAFTSPDDKLRQKDDRHNVKAFRRAAHGYLLGWKCLGWNGGKAVVRLGSSPWLQISKVIRCCNHGRGLGDRSATRALTRSMREEVSAHHTR